MAWNVRYGSGTARKKLRAYWKSCAEICPLCGERLDWSLKDPLDPMYPVIDEKIPLKYWPEEMRHKVATSIETTQAVHRHCNAEKGAKMPSDLGKATKKRGPIRVSQAY